MVKNKPKLQTEEEIRRSYKQAENKKEQLQILADLNACSVNDIRVIIGEPVANVTAEKKEKVDWDGILQALKDGMSVEDAAARFNTTVTYINRRRARWGSPANADSKISKDKPGKTTVRKEVRPVEPKAPCIQTKPDELYRIDNILCSLRKDDLPDVKELSKRLVAVLAEQAVDSILASLEETA